MKKISIKLLGLALVLFQGAALSSCDSKDDDAPAIPEVTVTQTHYNLAQAPITVEVKASTAPATDLHIPLSVSGDAKENSDYTLSSSEFVIKAGETTGAITVSRGSAEAGDNNVTLTLNLKPGTGYTLNAVNYCEITLLGKNGYIMTFSKAEASLLSEDSYSIKLSTMDNKDYRVQVEETFEIEVVTDKSTAVEGENFSFPEGKTIKVPVKKSEGSFKVKLLKADPEKNILVVRLKEKTGFATGSNPTMTIKVNGPDNLSGTYAFSGIINLDLFEMYGENIELAPKGSAADQFTLSGSNEEGYTFTPNFSGDLKNYFGTDSRKVTSEGVQSKLFQELMGKFVNVQVLKFPGINTKFSAKYTETRDASVGFRLIEVDGKEILEMTIDDFAPADDEFGGMTYAFMKDMDQDGVKGSQWMPYRVHFTRVK